MRINQYVMILGLIILIATPVFPAVRPVKDNAQDNKLNPRVVAMPDLVVDSITISNPIKEGEKIGQPGIFTISIKNSGNIASGPCKIRIALIATNGGPPPAELSGQRDCHALAPGDSFAFTWPDLSTHTWLSGNYRLTVEADNGNLIKESNENNNVRLYDFNVLGKPSTLPHDIFTRELTLTGRTIPRDVTTGELTLTGKVVPRDITTGELTLTGKVVPSDITTGELTLTGKVVPSDIATGELTLTGRVIPSEVTTGELTLTGRVIPSEVTTGQLTITGK